MSGFEGSVQIYRAGSGKILSVHQPNILTNITGAGRFLEAFGGYINSSEAECAVQIDGGDIVHWSYRRFAHIAFRTSLLVTSGNNGQPGVVGTGAFVKYILD